MRQAKDGDMSTGINGTAGELSPWWLLLYAAAACFGI